MDVALEQTDSRRVRFFKHSAWERAHRLARQIFGSAFAIALCMWGLIGWSLWSDYDQAMEAARRQQYNLVTALSGDLRMTIDSMARSFNFIQFDVGTGHQKLSWPARFPHLEEEARINAASGQELRIADAEGRLVLVTEQAASDQIGIADEPHFQRHRDDPGSALSIESVGDKDTARIQVSRRLQAPDGTFAGEASIVMPIDGLLNLHRYIDLGPHGLVVITDLQGNPLACFDHDHPNGTHGGSLNMARVASVASLKPGGLAAYQYAGQPDGIERLIAVRRLMAYDLKVLVGLDMRDVLGPVRGHVWLTCMIGGGATVLLAVLSWLLVREIWRRTRKEIELTADRERLQQAQAQIEVERSRLAAMNSELLISKERAEDANRTKSQFLAHMSHELRTPLHAIIGFSELIRDQAPTKPSGPPLATYAADILTSGRHLLDLINTILDITKIESGTATLSETEFPAMSVVENALVTIKAQADRRGIRIDLKAPDVPIRLHADRTRLLQILINLLSNAVKFTPSEGSITVSAAINAAGEAVLSVVDSGIGMTPAEIVVALEPFGQVENSFSRSYEGTGLGLPLAARLVEMHGGRLDLSSTKGKGTAARVILPSHRVAQQAGAVA